MSGLDTLPDAPTVAQMVIAATGESPSDLRIVGQGVTAVAWRVEADGGPYCVLIALPPHGPESEWPGAGGQMEARAAVLEALRERDPRTVEVLGTATSPGVPERLRRWSWMVTSWIPGAPLESAEEMTPEVARELGGLLAKLHAIPATGHGLLADTRDAIRGASEDPGAHFTSRWGQDLWPFDGRPLVAHPLARIAPALVMQVSPLREQLLAYVDQGARAVCHTDFSPGHVWTEDGHLTGLIDFGDAAVLPPAIDLALFASVYGWDLTEALLEGYASNSVLRDVRRAEAYQLAVLIALQRVEKYVRFKPDEARARKAVAFLEATLPNAIRRTDA